MILDGWWPEAYNGDNGWAIGDADGPDGDEAAVDDADAEALYHQLETAIVPLFYDRDEHDVPHGWLAVVRAAMAGATPAFDAERMVREYVEKVYAPAARQAAGG